jgi:hypothetical protein
MENLAGFAEAAHARLRDDDPALRKSYVRQFVERIEVDDDEVRITDPTPASPRRRWAPGQLRAACVPRFQKVASLDRRRRTE